MTETPVGLLAACIFCGFTIEALVGFGGLTFALALGALIAPLAEVVPIVVPSSVVLTAIVVARGAGEVAWAVLLRLVLPMMAIGLCAGWLLSSVVAPAAVQLVFGLVVLVLGTRGLFPARTRCSTAGSPRASGADPARARSGPRAPDGLLLLGAGILHGMCALGGPLVAYTFARRDMVKETFRCTLAAMFLTFNASLTAAFLLSGRIGTAALGPIAVSAPMVLAAFLAGSVVHRRVSEDRFRRIAFGLMIVAGALAAARAVA